jgi:hypothetical protein
MIKEINYICWHGNQTEGDAKELKAPSIKAAARKAVDIWRHENLEELGQNKVTVFVKDDSHEVHEIVITQDGDTRAPEAFQ